MTDEAGAKAENEADTQANHNNFLTVECWSIRGFLRVEKYFPMLIISKLFIVTDGKKKFM